MHDPHPHNTAEISAYQSIRTIHKLLPLLFLLNCMTSANAQNTTDALKPWDYLSEFKIDNPKPPPGEEHPGWAECRFVDWVLPGGASGANWLPEPGSLIGLKFRFYRDDVPARVIVRFNIYHISTWQDVSTAQSLEGGVSFGNVKQCISVRCIIIHIGRLSFPPRKRN